MKDWYTMARYLEQSPPIEDEEYDDVDMSSAWSVASIANDLVTEHGRRFPNYRYGSSPFPMGDAMADENELSLHNLTIYLQHDHLYTAPLNNPKNILDVKCGKNGYWAKNVADVFGDAQVTAFDVFCPDDEGRENLQFILQSFNDQWILDEVLQTHGQLDFIFAKSLFGASQDYPTFYRQCLEHLKPGGYLEQSEIVPYPSCDDGHFRTNSILKQLGDLGPALQQTFNTDYNIASNMRRLIEEAGFVDVEERVVKVPWSPWHPVGVREHELGRKFQRFYETGLEGWILAPLCRHLNFKHEDVVNMCRGAFRELRQNDQHFYSQHVTVVARKPLNPPP